MEAAHGRSRTSPSVAVAGFLAVACLFIASNPHMGVIRRMWPWESFREAPDRLLQSSFLLWVVTGVAAVVLACLTAARARATIVLALLAPLLVISLGRGGAFPITLYHFGEFLTLTLLGAGLWLQAKAHPRPGRWLCVAAGLLFLWTLVASNDAQFAGTRLGVLWREVTSVLSGEVVRPDEPNYALWTLLPRALLTLAAGLGVLHVLIRSRWFSRITWAVLFVGILFPVAAGVGTAHRIDTDVVLKAIYNGATLHGAGLWLLGTFAIADALLVSDPGTGSAP